MKKNKLVFACLLVIVLLGGILRFYNLGVTALDRDEFFEANTSYGYFKTGDFVAWDFNTGKPFDENLQDSSSNERAEVYRWQLAQLYRFFEPSEALMRSLSALWGILGIIVVFLVAFSFTGDVYIALLAAFLVAVGESGIIFGRRLRMYSMMYPVYLILSWFVYKFYESAYEGKNVYLKKIHEFLGFNPSYLLGVLLAGIISADVHLATLNIGFTVVAYCLIRWFWFARKKPLMQKIINIHTMTIFGALGSLVALRLFFYPFYKFIRKQVRFFDDNYIYITNVFSDTRYVWIGIALVLVGTWYLARKMKRPKEALFLFVSFFVPLCASIFLWNRTPAHRYVYFVQSFVVILSAIGIVGIIRLMVGRFGNYKKVIIIIGLILTIFALNFEYIKGKKSLYLSSEKSAYADFRKVFAYVLKNAEPGDAIVTRAYRSFYWQGANFKTYGIKSNAYSFSASNCVELFQDIVAENKSGFVVLPNIDKAYVCSAGREYLNSSLKKVDDKSFSKWVVVYTWGK